MFPLWALLRIDLGSELKLLLILHLLQQGYLLPFFILGRNHPRDEVGGALGVMRGERETRLIKGGSEGSALAKFKLLLAAGPLGFEHVSPLFHARDELSERLLPGALSIPDLEMLFLLKVKQPLFLFGFLPEPSFFLLSLKAILGDPSLRVDGKIIC